MKERNYRVLIVEDQRELARMIRLAVGSLGEAFTAIDVPSAEEALLEATRHPVDVLVADLRLPGMGGDEMIRRLRRQGVNPKVFLITALPEDEARAAAEALQVQGLFRKPFEMADLLDAIERHLGLVDSALGESPAPSAAEYREQMRRRLSDLVAGLRRELGFHSLMLIGETGYALVRAGEWPQGVEERRLITRLLTLLSAGNKVGRALGEATTRGLYVFRGQQWIVFMTNVSDQFALLAWARGPLAGEELSRVAHGLWDSAAQLDQMLRQWGLIEDQSAEAEPAAGLTLDASPEEDQDADEEEPAEDLLGILDAKDLPLAAEDAEAFWESLVSEDPGVADTTVDALSFDQARQLGLVPPTESDEQE